MLKRGLVIFVSLPLAASRLPAADEAPPATRPAAAASAAPAGAMAAVKFDPHEWCEYDGDIDGRLRIGMTLRFDQTGHVLSGAYYYFKYCRDIRIEGERNGRQVHLREFDAAGKQTGRFDGEFVQTDPRGHFGRDSGELGREVLVGTWTKPGGNGRKPFYLVLSHANIVDPGQNRYRVAGFDNDAAVDAFVSRFRAAVIGHKADLVAGMVQYPISVDVAGKRKEVASRAELIRDYDAIFTPKYVAKIEAAAPTHLFCRYDGVMLGAGLVWFAPPGDDGKQAGAAVVVVGINN